MTDIPFEGQEKQFLQPTYTQVPNIVFDYWATRIKPTSYLVLTILCRKIFGWHKTSDTISKNQLMKCTGLTKNTVKSAIDELESKKIILKHQHKNEYGFSANTYSLNVQMPKDEIYDDPGQNIGGGRSNDDPGVGQPLTHSKERLTKEKNRSIGEASNKEPPEKRAEPEKTDRPISYDCLKELPLPDEEKIQLSRFFTDEERLKNAVAFATADGFMPDNLAAVITSNYKNNRKPSKGADSVISHNKAFSRAFIPLMGKVLGAGANSRLEALNGHLEYTGVGGSNWPCWEWGSFDFIETIRSYFTSRKLWNGDMEDLVLKYRT